MKTGLLFVVFISSSFLPSLSLAAVDNLGQMINQGYKDQAAAYRAFQKSLKGEMESRDVKNAQDLERLGESKTDGESEEMGVRLVMESK
jgi:hypothetical protein